MVRHKGIGMNKARKTKVLVPQVFYVRLRLRGYVPDKADAFEAEQEGPSRTRAPTSPGKKLVQAAKQLAQPQQWFKVSRKLLSLLLARPWH